MRRGDLAVFDVCNNHVIFAADCCTSWYRGGVISTVKSKCFEDNKCLKRGECVVLPSSSPRSLHPTCTDPNTIAVVTYLPSGTKDNGYLVPRRLSQTKDNAIRFCENSRRWDQSGVGNDLSICTLSMYIDAACSIGRLAI